MELFFMNFKRNMKAAFKTVKANFREYVCFIIALTMVQMLFCVLTISVFNDRKIEEQVYAARGYDYHCSITGLDASDVNTLMEIKKLYDTKEKLKFSYKSSGSEFRITFESDYAACYQVFSEAVKGMNARYDHATLSSTPLLAHDRDAVGAYARLLPLLGLAALLCFFLVTALFRIRLNHFKFTYAVYMTFGADRRKLLAAAFYEMMLLVLLTFLPAAALSYGVCALLYLPRGSAFGFYFLSLPITLFCSLVTTLAAILLPVTLLSRTMPVKALRAEDNANLASPARKSVNLRAHGPAAAELLGMWRFRKYLAILLLSTVGFSSLFFAGCAIAQAFTADEGIMTPAFTVSADSESRLTAFLSFFETNAKANGVDASYEKAAADPFAPGGAREDDVPPVLAVKSDLAVPGVFEELSGGDGYAITGKLTLRAYDADARACLDDVYRYRYEGDPDRPLTHPDEVIVSSSLGGSKALKVRPGDVVYLSVNYYRFPHSVGTGADLSTASISAAGSYVFRAYTVAAVIEDFADPDDMLLCLPVCPSDDGISAFEAVTGSAPAFTEARIYVEGEDQEKIAAMIVDDYRSEYGGVEYDRGFSTVEEEAAAAKNRPGLILLFSALILAVSPLAGVYSQQMFYAKRQTEFDVLRAVGASRKHLTKIFAVDAALSALLSGVFYTLVCLLLTRLITGFLNSNLSVLISGGAHGKIYGTLFPPLPFFLGLALTVLFAALAVFLPAARYLRQAGDHIAKNFAQTDE